jgi:hypothetical protein
MAENVRIKIEVPLLFPLEESISAELKKAIKQIDSHILSSLRAEFRSRGKVATGGTIKSLRSKSAIDTASFTVEIFGSRQRATNAIENGRARNKPQPPSTEILKWMESKGIGAGKTDKEKERIAYLIARSIGENGIEPTRIFGDVLDKESDYIQSKIEEALTKAILSFNT